MQGKNILYKAGVIGVGGGLTLYFGWATHQAMKAYNQMESAVGYSLEDLQNLDNLAFKNGLIAVAMGISSVVLWFYLHWQGLEAKKYVPDPNKDKYTPGPS